MRDIKERYTPELLAKRNVVGVGIGEKISHGERTGQQAISVLVEEKEPDYALRDEDIIPNALDAVPTDVVPVGILKAPLPIAEGQGYQDKMRPARPGCSIGHARVTAGTFGAVVMWHGERAILSNNHVLALSNDADFGDPIWQPGRYDGGTADDHIADLSAYAPISFSEIGSTCAVSKLLALALNAAASTIGSRQRFKAYQREQATNTIDAAVARPLDQALIDADTLGNIGAPKGLRAADLDIPVTKAGRTTGLTTGRVTQMWTTVRVSYGSGRIAVFHDQIVAAKDNGEMSAGGDSGSGVFDMDGYLIGLLFAGSSGPNPITIMNPIDKVFSILNLRLP
jgi:hypothetical protein